MLLFNMERMLNAIIRLLQKLITIIHLSCVLSWNVQAQPAASLIL